MFYGIGQEPTNHALHDIEKMKDKLDKWGRPFVLLFKNEAEAKKFQAQKGEFPNLPAKTIFGIDKDGIIQQEIVKEMKLRNTEQLPILSSLIPLTVLSSFLKDIQSD